MNNFAQNPQNEDRGGNYFYKNKSTKKVISTIALAVLVLLVIIGACLGCFFGGKATQINDNLQDDLAVANEVYTLIKKYYYQDIDKDEFNKWAAIGISSVMDQFSGLSYSSVAATLQFGINIKSDSYNNHVITYVTPNSPASEAKLERGDLLISVDGESVQGLTTDVLNGPLFLGKATEKQSIKLVVQKSNGMQAEFELKKSYIVADYANYQDFGGGVGYIKLNSFTGVNNEINAATEFAKCAQQFKNNSNSKLILDLRDNGGGSVNLLAKIASYLIHDKQGNSNGLNIIKLDTDKGNKSSYCTAEGNNWLGKGIADYKLVVLVNEGSASASEALLGAIKYYCSEATIIGSPTYGKGIAQQTYQLTTTPNYLLGITIGYFYVPVDNGGKQDWKTYHGKSMEPTAGYKVDKFSSLIDFTKDDIYKSYYNNNVKAEAAIRLALQALS